jgi:hypothetical protein
VVRVRGVRLRLRLRVRVRLRVRAMVRVRVRLRVRVRVRVRLRLRQQDACRGLHVWREEHGGLLARDHRLELLDRARRVLRRQPGVGPLRLRLDDDVLRRDVAPCEG